MKNLFANLREAVSTWFAADLPNLVFALKTSVAGLLALWISFRLDFAQPQWALMTVFIISRPESGLVMTKGFYRVLGTIAGSAAALILTGLFAQSTELFILSLATWIGLNVALAARYRNFQSYGFMLAGYTAAIIGFGAAADPNHAFDIAQARVSEVVLGILCASVVAEAFFPVHASVQLVPAALARFTRFKEFLRHAFSLDFDSGKMLAMQQAFLADIVASETQRSSSVFEGAEARLRDARVRWMNASFMKASTTLYGFIQTMRRLRLQAPAEGIAIITSHYDELAGCMMAADGSPAAVAARLATYRSELHVRHRQAMPETAEAVPMRGDIAAAFRLYLRVVDELVDYVDAMLALSEPGRPTPPAVPAYALHADSWVATLSGLRAVGVLFAVSAFWIATAWPGGSGAATLGAIICMLFGSAPAPTIVVQRVARGFVLGQLMAFVCMFFVLPQADAFPSVALCMLPFLAFSAWMIVHPRFASEGSGIYLAMISSIPLHNQMHYDIVDFLNNCVGVFIGLGAASIAFSVFPSSPTRLRDRLLARLRDQVADACRAPLREGALRHRFESRTRDLLYQLTTPPAAMRELSGPVFGHAMTILEVGQMAIELRTVLERQSRSETLHHASTAMLDALVALCRNPDDASRTALFRALDQLRATLDGAADIDAEMRDELQANCYLIRSALQDDEAMRHVRGAAEWNISIPGASHAT